MIQKWVCKQCEKSCTFEREVSSYFAPERCVYNERGNGDKKAQWIKKEERKLFHVLGNGDAL